MTPSPSSNKSVESLTIREIRLLLDKLILEPVSFQLERILLTVPQRKSLIRPALRPVMESYKKKLVLKKSLNNKDRESSPTLLISELSIELYLIIKILLSSGQVNRALDLILCFQEFFIKNPPWETNIDQLKLQKALRKIGSDLIERYNNAHSLSQQQRQALYLWILEHKDNSSPITAYFIEDLMCFIRSCQFIKEYKLFLKNFVDTLKRSSLSFWTLKYPKVLKEYEDNKRAKQRYKKRPSE